MRRPNFLIIMTDEERFPTCYESEALKAYRDQFLPGHKNLMEKAMVFERHYAASTACEPSRASIFTGQYPSLHGVSQTSGLAKSSSDPGEFWLPPNTVPTIGHYFRAGDYRTHYHGKWHVSDQDLMIPGTNNGLLSNGPNGEPYPERIEAYRNANRLNDYGFNGWIGPEPHGSLSNNTGLMRDPGFARQTVELLQQLNNEAAQNADYQPWLTVCSFGNPHDISFYGQSWKMLGLPEVDFSAIPDIDQPPTRFEDLACKPRCQKDYVINFSNFFYRQPTIQSYYKLYFYLQAEVDRHIHAVYTALSECRHIFEDTIVIFTSDHGDALGSHGGMHQKWFNAYEECIRVPLVISNPKMFDKTHTTHTVSSHVDLLPTLLDLAGIDQKAAAEKLQKTHTEVHDPVGKSLKPVLDGDNDPDSTVYFMTDDEPDQGLNEMTAPKLIEIGAVAQGLKGDALVSALSKAWIQRLTPQSYRPVIEPHHVETVITRVDGRLYKLSRYFENPRFVGQGVGNPDGTVSQYGAPDEWELYDLDADPIEADNLMSSCSRNKAPDDLVKVLKERLREQRAAKRLLPTTTNQDAGA